MSYNLRNLIAAGLVEEKARADLCINLILNDLFFYLAANIQ